VLEPLASNLRRPAPALVLIAVSACGGRTNETSPASSCNDNGTVHANGTSWTCSDGCNTCSCKNGEIASTLVACLRPKGGALSDAGLDATSGTESVYRLRRSLLPFGRLGAHRRKLRRSGLLLAASAAFRLRIGGGPPQRSRAAVRSGSAVIFGFVFPLAVASANHRRDSRPLSRLNFNRGPEPDLGCNRLE
jgi:hypothetical protein